MSEDVKKALEDVSALVAIVAKDTGALVMSDPAEDSVGSTLEGDLEMTFGHVRRAHAALSTLESLQRENEALKKDRDFWKEQFQVETRYRIELADRGTLLALTDANSRAEAAEAEVKRLQAEIDRKSSMPGDHRYWEGRYRDEAADNEKLRGVVERAQSIVSTSIYPSWHETARTALASTGGEDHAE